MELINFSKRLKKIMEKYNLIQSDIASILGVSEPMVTKYMKGINIPSPDKLYILSEKFNLNPAWLMGYSVQMENTKKGSDFVKMPILGSIPAGVPFQAIEDIEEFIYIPKERIKGNISDFFLLKIEGDSMSPKYLDGDVLLFNVNPSPNNGAEVAVMVNGNDATFKQIFIKEDGITLHAYNPFYKDRFFSREEIIELPVKVIGQVQSLEYRDLR